MGLEWVPGCLHLVLGLECSGAVALGWSSLVSDSRGSVDLEQVDSLVADPGILDSFKKQSYKSYSFPI